MPVWLMPVALPGVSRLLSTTARLKSPGQPQPSVNASSVPATNDGTASVAIRTKPSEPAASRTTTLLSP